MHFYFHIHRALLDQRRKGNSKKFDWEKLLGEIEEELLIWICNNFVDENSKKKKGVYKIVLQIVLRRE